MSPARSFSVSLYHFRITSIGFANGVTGIEAHIIILKMFKSVAITFDVQVYVGEAPPVVKNNLITFYASNALGSLLNEVHFRPEMKKLKLSDDEIWKHEIILALNGDSYAPFDWYKWEVLEHCYTRVLLSEYVDNPEDAEFGFIVQLPIVKK